jgi:hypothetical protein
MSSMSEWDDRTDGEQRGAEPPRYEAPVVVSSLPFENAVLATTEICGVDDECTSDPSGEPC